MIERVYRLGQLKAGQEKLVEKVVVDKYLNYIHMILPPGQGLPEHNSNANLYMTVVAGVLTLGLDGEESRNYERGNLVTIPKGIKMNVTNQNNDVLELIVVKVPPPE